MTEGTNNTYTNAVARGEADGQSTFSCGHPIHAWDGCVPCLRVENERLRAALRTAYNDFSEQVFYWNQPERYRTLRGAAQDRIDQALRETWIHKPAGART